MITRVSGALTVHGRTRPLSFDAAVTVPGDGAAWLDAAVRINRGDFGLTWNQLGMVPMDYTLTIRAIFTRRAGAGAAPAALGRIAGRAGRPGRSVWA